MKPAIKNVIEPLIFFAALLILWEIFVEVIKVPSFILPPPRDLGRFRKEITDPRQSLAHHVHRSGGWIYLLFGSRSNVRHCRGLFAPSSEYNVPAHRHSLRHAEERLRAAHGDLGGIWTHVQDRDRFSCDVFRRGEYRRRA